MRFAVVEYSSKSRDIWQHTDAKPNYLADPATEIDPTSFGTWVSAMDGEHIPLTKLIKSESIWRKIYKRLTNNWPPYSVAELNKYDVLMVVHQLSNAHEMVRLLKRLDGPKVIGVATQPYGILHDETKKDTEANKNLIAFIQNCDQFISIDKKTTSWYSDCSSRPVEYLPQPYPVEHATKYFKRGDQKENIIMVAGVTQRENIKLGQQVAKELKKKFPDFEIVVPKVAELDYDFSGLKGIDYRVLDFEPWHTHLQTLAKIKLVINTDFIHTRGRLQMDLAAVGTPSLGSNSDAQYDLFPELAGTPVTTLEELVSAGEKILSDDNRYRRVVDKAQSRISFYNYTNSKKRLTELLQ